MRKGYRKNLSRKKKGVSFNPTHEYCDDAVKEFLAKGGKINKVDDLHDEYERFVAQYQSTTSSADTFLLGR